jgi:RNA polymerase sigma factor (sigma-70 family)
VADGYERLSPYLYQLQTLRDESAWSPLLVQMQTWAAAYFARKVHFAPEVTAEIAADCALEAARRMLDAHFPYDTEFAPWAHVLVQNICKKFLQKEHRKSAIPQENLTSLEDVLETLRDTSVQEQTSQRELRAELEEAMARLSTERRRVLELAYFEGLSPTEIAKVMGKTPNAISCLKFNALADLRKILTQIRDNNNE